MRIRVRKVGRDIRVIRESRNGRNRNWRERESSIISFWNRREERERIGMIRVRGEWEIRMYML